MNDPTKYIIDIAAALYKETQKYSENPTKAASKRIRMLLGQIKKEAAGMRSDLMVADDA